MKGRWLIYKQNFKLVYIGLLLLLSINLKASHIMGGDFSYTYVGGGKYYVQLTLYRDCAGVSAPSTVTLTASSASCGSKYNSTFTLAQVGSCVEVTPVSPHCSYSSTCSGGSDPGVQQCKYGDTIALPGHCKDWVLTIKICNRNAAITNLTATGTCMTIVCTINNSIGITASSPVFSSIPTPYLCPGTSEIYSQGAYDPDGDSLSFAQIAPHNNTAYDSVPYVSGYSSRYPLSVIAKTSFCNDPQTGQLNFTPSKAQVTVIAIEVSKYRKISGVWTKIGSVERDMQINVLSGSLCKGNKPPLMHTPTGVSGGTVSASSKGCSKDSTYTFTVCEGQLLKFTLPCIDSVSTQLLTVTTNGATSIPGATVTITNGSKGNNTKYVNFTWKPKHADAGTHLFTSSLSDTACPLKGLSSYVTKIVVIPKTYAGLDTTICIGTSAKLRVTGGDTFTWTSSSSTTPTTGNIITVNPTLTTTYYVKSNYAPCDNHDTVIVFVQSQIKVVNALLTICAGRRTTLAAISNPIGTTFLWSPGGNTTSSIIVTPTITSTFYLTIKNSLGCSYTDTVLINVNPLPIITVNTAQNNFCKGITDTLTATGGNTYKWSPGSSTGNTLSVTPTDTTVYTAIVTTSKGCVDSAKIKINVKPLPNIATSPNYAFICPGTKEFMVANGGVSYTWQPGNYTTDTVYIIPTAPTTYTVTGKGANGCFNTATVKYNTKPVPKITFTPTHTGICIGSNDTIKVRGGNSYIWQPTSKTDSNLVVTPKSNTRYTVKATATNGCSDTSSILIKVNTLPKITATASNTSVCKNALDTIVASGTKTYKWNTLPIDTGAVLIFSTAVNNRYIVTGTDTNGCTDTTSIYIVTKPLPIITLTSGKNAICFGNSDTLQASGGISYTWQPSKINNSTIIISPSTTTTYTVFATGANGCINNYKQSITVNALPVITISTTSTAICIGSSASLLAKGALTYSWLPGSQTTASITVNPTSTAKYLVKGTDSKGCQDTASLNIVVNSLPKISASALYTSICKGKTDTLLATGGINYVWMPGSITSKSISVSPIVTTHYKVTGTDANGCKDTSGFNVVVNSLPVIKATSSHSSICLNNSDTLFATGAVSYIWQPGNITSKSLVVTPTITTIYTLTGTDVNKCSSTVYDTITIKPLPTITVSASSTSVCKGNSSTLLATGASTYLWKPGKLTGSSITVTPNSSTAYVVIGTDSNGCIDSSSLTLTVTVHPLPVVKVSASYNAICSGNSDTLQSSGAISYSWMPGSYSGSKVIINPTSSTRYLAKGTDANGCFDTASILITVKQAPSISATAKRTTICSGKLDTLTASGGVNYVWMPGRIKGNTIIVNPTTTTTYTVIGTGVNSCTNTYTITITVNTLPHITATATPSSVCLGSGAVLNAFNGVSYVWMPANASGNSISIHPIASTRYKVTGTDANGCIDTASVLVTINALPKIIIKATPTHICKGDTTGALLSVKGGKKYLWKPIAFTDSVVTVKPSLTTRYYVTVTDGNNCSDTTSINVKVDTLPTISVTSDSLFICLHKSEKLKAGGINLTYVWLPAHLTSASITVSPTTTTRYTVTGTNTNGCKDTISILVVVKLLPHVKANVAKAVICVRDSTTLIATGALSYIWQPGAVASNPYTLYPTTTKRYTLTGTDANHCADTASVFVTVNPLPIIKIIAAPSKICVGDSATLSASGGKVYLWQPGAILDSIIVVKPSLSTSYSVSVTDAHACFDTAGVLVHVDSLPVFYPFASNSVICIYDSTSLFVHKKGITFTWQPANVVADSIVVKPLATSTYTLSGIDGHNCKSVASIVISVNPLPLIKAFAAPSVICLNDSTRLSATGAISYHWLPGAFNDSAKKVSPYSSTRFFVWGTDLNLCSDTASVFVTVNALPTVKARSSNNNFCGGDTATLSAKGALSYFWLPGADTGLVIHVRPLVSTIYTLTGTDINGCKDTAHLFIHVKLLPALTAVADPAAICPGSFSALSAKGAVSYLWLPPNIFTAGLSVKPAVTSTFYVTGTGANGCVKTDTVIITVHQPPILDAHATHHLACSNVPDTLVAKGAVKYLWEPGKYRTDTVILNPPLSATFTVTGTDSFGCVNADTASIDVVFKPSNGTHFDTSVYKGTSIKLFSSNKHSTYYLWKPDTALSDTSARYPICTPEKPETYLVTYLDKNGCYVHDTFFVKLKRDCLGIFVPNAFSPNGDGVNDVLKLIPSHGETLLLFRVYNRWGHLVFETNDVKVSWDGSFNGQSLDMDAYVYYIQFMCTNGQTILQKGNITLIK